MRRATPRSCTTACTSGARPPPAGTTATRSTVPPTTGTRTYRDNIFFNARSDAGSGGSNFAIRAAIVDGVFLSNNNVLRAPGVNGIIGRLNATNTPTLAQWQAFTGQDLQKLGGGIPTTLHRPP